MGTGTIIAIAVIAYFMLQSTFGSTDLGGSLLNTATGAGTGPQPINIPIPSIAQLLAAVAQSNNPNIYYSSDQWCYAYMNATGVQCPSSSVVGDSMNATQFIAALQAYVSSGGVSQVVPSAGVNNPASSAPVTGPSNAIVPVQRPGRTSPISIPVVPRPGAGPASMSGLAALADCTIDLHHAPTGKWEM